MKPTIPVKTPFGITMPLIAYTAVVAAAITAGASILSLTFDYPAWIWILVFIGLWGITFLWARFSATQASDEAWTIQNRRLLTVSGIGAVLLVIALVAW